MAIEAPAGGSAAEPPPIALRVLGAIAPWIGLTGFAIAAIVQFAQDGTAGWESEILQIALTWLVGVNGIVYGSGHLFMPDAVADSIGWGRGSPFQWEVGLAKLSYRHPDLPHRALRLERLTLGVPLVRGPCWTKIALAPAAGEAARDGSTSETPTADQRSHGTRRWREGAPEMGDE